MRHTETTDREPGPTPEGPRLLLLADLLEALVADAQAAHTAHATGQPCGAQT